MPSEPRQIVDLSMRGKKSLRMAVELESAYLSLLLTRVLMGDFGSAVRAIEHGWHHFSLRCAVAVKLVGRDVGGQLSLTLIRHGKLIELPALDNERAPQDLQARALAVHALRAANL
ncbi:MAG: hypothetical protein ACI8W7_002103 [Gammaproteobacteria bacterium]|jgi:hypothetical protein